MKIRIPDKASVQTYGRTEVEAGSSRLALFSLISGILGWLVLPFIGALTAIVTGHMARADIRRSGKQGDGMAVAGLVLGYVWWAVLIPMLALLAALAVPIYQEYVHLNQARQIHTSLYTVYRAVNGQLVQGVAAADINRSQDEAMQHFSLYREAFDELAVGEGVIRIRYADTETVPSPMRGQSLQIIPTVSADGGVQWHCEGSLTERYRPGYCGSPSAP